MGQSVFNLLNLFEEETEIDIVQTQEEIQQLKGQLLQAEAQMGVYLKELGF